MLSVFRIFDKYAMKFSNISDCNIYRWYNKAFFFVQCTILQATSINTIYLKRRKKKTVEVNIMKTYHIVSIFYSVTVVTWSNLPIANIGLENRLNVWPDAVRIFDRKKLLTILTYGKNGFGVVSWTTKCIYQVEKMKIWILLSL